MWSTRITIYSNFYLNIEDLVHMENLLPFRAWYWSPPLPKSLHISDSRIFWWCSGRKYNRNVSLWIVICPCLQCITFQTQFVDLLIHEYFDGLCEQYYITEERYVEPEAKKKRSYTLVKWGYTSIYYILSSAWAYKILIGTSFMPTWLGGKDSPFTMLSAVPKVTDVTF